MRIYFGALEDEDEKARVNLLGRAFRLTCAVRNELNKLRRNNVTRVRACSEWALAAVLPCSAMVGKLQSIREIVDDLMSEPDRAQKWFEHKLADLNQTSLKKVPKKRAQSVQSEKRTKKRAGK